MNIEFILKDLGVFDVEVEYYDLGGVDLSVVDVWIVGCDLEDLVGYLGDVCILNSIIDMDELRELVIGIC